MHVHYIIIHSISHVPCALSHLLVPLSTISSKSHMSHVCYPGSSKSHVQGTLPHPNLYDEVHKTLCSALKDSDSSNEPCCSYQGFPIFFKSCISVPPPPPPAQLIRQQGMVKFIK